MCDIVWISISIRRRSLRRRRLRRLRQLARASLPSRLLRCDARTPPQPNPKPVTLDLKPETRHLSFFSLNRTCFRTFGSYLTNSSGTGFFLGFLLCDGRAGGGEERGG